MTDEERTARATALVLTRELMHYPAKLVLLEGGVQQIIDGTAMVEVRFGSDDEQVILGPATLSNLWEQTLEDCHCSFCQVVQSLRRLVE